MIEEKNHSKPLANTKIAEKNREKTSLQVLKVIESWNFMLGSS